MIVYLHININIHLNNFYIPKHHGDLSIFFRVIWAALPFLLHHDPARSFKLLLLFDPADETTFGKVKKKYPLPKFHIEQWWLEDYFPIGKVTVQGLC